MSITPTNKSHSCLENWLTNLNKCNTEKYKKSECIKNM